MTKVLVVENHQDWREDICRAVVAREGTPYAAASYHQAMIALDTHAFDLVVVNPVLDPDDSFNRDGLSIIQKIRYLNPAVPVIALTNNLTSDLSASLQRLQPRVELLSREQWSEAAFHSLTTRLLGQPATTLPAERPATSAVPVPTASPWGRPRVLVIENREDWQSIVTNILTEVGYFWRVAENAKQALWHMERESFHAVILDLKLQQNELPLRSNEGWLLLDHMLERWPKTKVIVLSGRASAGDVADLLTQYPIVSFIAKQSFTPEAVIKAVSQAAQAPRLRIQSLGQFRLWRDQQAVDIWEDATAETLVKMLLVRRAWGGYTVAADELITRLWGEQDDVAGRKKLSALVRAARHTLEPDIEPRNSNFIHRSNNGFLFDLGENITWDLLEFRQHLNQGRQLHHAQKWAEAATELEKGRTVYRGDFLEEDRAADWTLEIRQEVAGQLCELLTLLADAYAALGRYAEALAACEAALHKDPLLENIYRRLMRYHYCNGDKEQALKAYRDCLKLFEELFGEGPQARTRHLHDAIVADALGDCLTHDDSD